MSRRRILVVDDEVYITEILARWLEAAGYSCERAHSAEEALSLLAADRFELVVSDVMMPGMSGIELLEQVRAEHRDLAMIMATAVDDRSTAISTLRLGAYGYLIKPLDEDDVVINVAQALERRRLHMLDRQYQSQLEQEVRDRTNEIRQVREEVSLMLVSVSEFRDMDTGAHVRRMGLYAEALAVELGWGREIADDLRLVAPMHDVGKIGVPDSVLLKPGRLTDEEFEVIKGHASIGASILNRHDLPLLDLAGEIALSHHERWDGSGYPHGRVGESIPRAARLVAIVDVYDALVHDRVYRAALPEEEAIAIMKKGRGSHFDPAIFDVFVELLPDLRRIRQQVGSEAG